MMIAIMTIINTETTHADSFGSGVNQFNIDFVNIGNAGNGNDSGAGGGSYSSPYGGVAYDYRMGKYEISQAAINAAVVGGLTGMTAGMPVESWTDAQPAININWFQAAAFTNWLNTSTGHQSAYQLNSGLTAMTLWSSADAWQVGGQNRYRHKDAYYFLPSEDEWYKAAFHQNNGVTADYWDYATGSNSMPIAVSGGTLPGTAVFNQERWYSRPANIFNAGGLSPYGTMGQGGNVHETIESAYDGINNSPTEGHSYTGGSWLDGNLEGNCTLQSSNSPALGYMGPDGADWIVGFRVASVPEPSSMLLLISATVFALAARNRSKFNKQ